MVNPEFKHKESGQRVPAVELMLGSNDVRLWFLHHLFMLLLHLRTPVSGRGCSSRNLEIAHDGGSQPSVSSLQITECHLSRHPPSPGRQHFLSGLYHCLWTVSPFLFMLPGLPPPFHSCKMGVTSYSSLHTLTFVPLKTKRSLTFIVIWLLSLWPRFLPPCLTVSWPRACPVVQMCPGFCLVAAPCA